MGVGAAPVVTAAARAATLVGAMIGAGGGAALTAAGVVAGAVLAVGAGSAQPTAIPRIEASATVRAQRLCMTGAGEPAAPRNRTRRHQRNRMWVIVLEMLAALALLLFIVWWTMFAGRRRGERRDDRDAQ
jgi:sterol desaturase/sphingolipid hydroxylase (fatty acid hydroxylase superfamily)